MYSLKLANSLEILGLFPSHLILNVGEQMVSNWKLIT